MDRSVTDTRSNSVSVADRTRPIAAGAAVVDLHFLGSLPVFVLAEEHLLFAPADGEPRTVAVHDGAILSAASDGRTIVTGGDDGRVVRTGADGTVSVVATDPKRRWIDQVAMAGDGTVAWSAGKNASVHTGKAEKSVELPSTAGGLAFAPKGMRLAIAHYNGVSLWFPNTAAAPEMLPWKGSHLNVLFSPDGKYVMTAMQEAMLHGWRLADRRDMRMSGYATKVRSMGFTAGGRWLATSGADQLILWPFTAKDGPMGKAPRMLAPAASLVVAVACHPRQEVVAIGYADGMVLLVRIEDGAEIVAKTPGPAPVTALAWDAVGTQLGFGTEDGQAGVVTL